MAMAARGAAGLLLLTFFWVMEIYFKSKTLVGRILTSESFQLESQM